MIASLENLVSHGTGDAGDKYAGLDRFGRITQQLWMSGNTIVDGYGYAYDRDSNVTAKLNALNSTFSEDYSYDSLNRLTNYTRNATTSSYQSFTLNAVGDMTAITTGNITQNRTINSDNQITALSNGTSSALTLTYDNNGNLTTDDHGDTLIYDAWNRLIQVNGTSGSAIATYSYDGGGRRITATESGTTTDFYFNGQQDIEERQGKKRGQTYLNHY